MTIIEGDALTVLRNMPDQCVHTCVTSPPYFGLRDYGNDGQIGLETTPGAYVERLVDVFREVRRVLRDDGTLWLNLGDSYVGSASTGGLGKETAYTGKRVLPNKTAPDVRAKNLLGIPWRVAFALQADGWYLRQDIIWHKPNPMPESVTDRCTKAHEYIFLLSKSPRYYFDAEAVKEAASQNSGWAKQRKAGIDTWKYGRAAGGDPHSTNGIGGTLATGSTRNRRSVWTVSSKPYKGAHFATFPPDLIEPCILAGAPVDGLVLDPFAGSGTVMMVAARHGRGSIGIELNPEYIALAHQRLADAKP